MTALTINDLDTDTMFTSPNVIDTDDSDPCCELCGLSSCPGADGDPCQDSDCPNNDDDGEDYDLTHDIAGQRIDPRDQDSDTDEGEDEDDSDDLPAHIAGGAHDEIGEARSIADLEIARTAGFAPKETVYRRGTRVISLGVENARKSREQFDSLQDVDTAIADLIGVIAAEERKERVFNLASLEMDAQTGAINVPGMFSGERMERVAFQQVTTALTNKLGLVGGSAFLASLTGDGDDGIALRAYNVNAMVRAVRALEERERREHDRREVARYDSTIAQNKARETSTDGRVRRGKVQEFVGKSYEPHKMMARARTNGIFAVVGPEYPCFDTDLVAAAIARLNKRAGMKCEINYDGHGARFDIIAQTPVKPELFVAGEFFRVFYRVITRDDGKGSIKVQVGYWQNLCLNLIILDRSDIEVESITHKGDISKLAERLDAALIAAQEKLAGFLDKWNYACKQTITQEHVPAAPGHKYEKALSQDDLLAGVFRSLIERDLVPAGARKMDDAVSALMAAHKIDDSAAALHGPTRASVVNAITRVAHDHAFNSALELDMWDEAAWEQAGGKILDSKTPLLWIPAKVTKAAARKAAQAGAANQATVTPAAKAA